MKTFIKLFLAAAALSGSLASASIGGYANPSFDNNRGEDGWPLPWPFPWAKQCPMDWNNLSGTYLLSDSSGDGQLIVKVTVLMKRGLLLVRVSRYNHNGHLILDGTTTVTQRQKVVSLYMSPARGTSGHPAVWAVIKMHYDSSVFSCAADHLVPILTVQGFTDSAPPNGIDYKMKKVR